MKKNMGTVDKVLRVLVAVAIAVLYNMGVISGTLALVLGAVAAVFVATSLFSFCPLYLPLGIKTCKKKD